MNIIGSPDKLHYALIKEGEQNEIAVDDWIESYNISVLEYGPNFKDLAAELRALFEQVNTYRMNIWPS